MGLYEVPRYGMTPYPDEAMFEGLKKLQTAPGGGDHKAHAGMRDHLAASGGNSDASSKGSPNPPPIKIVPPTRGGAIRGVDRWGDGRFGANRKRGEPGKSGYAHQGTDFVTEPGEEIGSIISGTVIRNNVDPYGDGQFSGIIVRSDDGYESRILYVEPSVGVGTRVEAGAPIGTAQDLQERYPGITNHVHAEIWEGRARTGTPVDAYPATGE